MIVYFSKNKIEVERFRTSVPKLMSRDGNNCETTIVIGDKLKENINYKHNY